MKINFLRFGRTAVADCFAFRRNFLLTALFFAVFALLICWPDYTDHVAAEPLDKIAADTRCPVCGMFVAKFEIWITQIRTAENTVHSFDGVKDMMAFQFSPESFSNGRKQEITEIWVKDYYSLKWIEATNAFYVAGSDVYGPMGHELIPFSSRAAAESFMADHKGREIFAYPEITTDLINSLRSGQMMKK